MKILLSYIEWKREGFEYETMEDFRKKLKDLGLDGLELVSCWEENFIPKDLIHGVHLPYFSSWMDYYLKKTDTVVEEFGSMEVAKDLFSYRPEDLYKYYLQALKYADSLGAYSVFHVANCNSLEYLGQNHSYSDLEVIDQAAKIINKLLREAKPSSLFLMENLYVPGLKFTDPELTKRLLDKIDYENKGLVLDTGHLMCTNEEINSEDQAWDYIGEIVEKNRELLPYIRVVHLHSSLSGRVVKSYKKDPPKIEGDFYKRLEAYYKYVGKIDTHSLVRSKKAKKIIEKINPDYLVLEFSYEDRKDMEEKIKTQLQVLS